MKEKLPPQQENFDKQARLIRVLASSHLQVEEGLTEKEALERLTGMPKEEIIALAKKEQKKMLASFDTLENPQENVALMKKLKREHPEDYRKLMEEIKEEDPEYYEHLIDLHNK